MDPIFNSVYSHQTLLRHLSAKPELSRAAVEDYDKSVSTTVGGLFAVIVLFIGPVIAYFAHKLFHQIQAERKDEAHHQALLAIHAGSIDNKTNCLPLEGCIISVENNQPVVTNTITKEKFVYNPKYDDSNLPEWFSKTNTVSLEQIQENAERILIDAYGYTAESLRIRSSTEKFKTFVRQHALNNDSQILLTNLGLFLTTSPSSSSLSSEPSVTYQEEDRGLIVTVGQNELKLPNTTLQDLRFGVAQDVYHHPDLYSATENQLIAQITTEFEYRLLMIAAIENTVTIDDTQTITVSYNRKNHDRLDCTQLYPHSQSYLKPITFVAQQCRIADLFQLTLGSATATILDENKIVVKINTQIIATYTQQNDDVLAEFYQYSEFKLLLLNMTLSKLQRALQQHIANNAPSYLTMQQLTDVERSQIKTIGTTIVTSYIWGQSLRNTIFGEPYSAVSPEPVIHNGEVLGWRNAEGGFDKLPPEVVKNGISLIPRMKLTLKGHRYNLETIGYFLHADDMQELPKAPSAGLFPILTSTNEQTGFVDANKGAEEGYLPIQFKGKLVAWRKETAIERTDDSLEGSYKRLTHREPDRQTTVEDTKPPSKHALFKLKIQPEFGRSVTKRSMIRFISENQLKAIIPKVLVSDEYLKGQDIGKMDLRREVILKLTNPSYQYCHSDFYPLALEIRTCHQHGIILRDITSLNLIYDKKQKFVCYVDTDFMGRVGTFDCNRGSPPYIHSAFFTEEEWEGCDNSAKSAEINGYKKDWYMLFTSLIELQQQVTIKGNMHAQYLRESGKTYQPCTDEQIDIFAHSLQCSQRQKVEVARFLKDPRNPISRPWEVLKPVRLIHSSRPANDKPDS